MEEHLSSVAERARTFAASYGPAWAYCAGLLHDAGKFWSRFQERLDDNSVVAPHALLGASLSSVLGSYYVPLVIAGHHAGIPALNGPEGIKERLRDVEIRSVADSLRSRISSSLADAFRVPVLPTGSARSRELWIRFLFSALVDADWLDTEAFYTGKERRVARVGFAWMLEQLESKLKSFGEPNGDPVLLMRRAVLDSCKAAATNQQGAFTLTAPTGGAKTLASLRFALHHLQAHPNLQRIIVVLPYCAIIEQTAKVLRDLFGTDSVVEHHSNVEFYSPRARLAVENWDAPLIVTTNAQFYDSLFANRPATCRKLHNIASSVVILDEVQTIPSDKRAPIEEVLQELVRGYSSTIVLCTATQPALSIPATEIIADVPECFRRVSGRIQVQTPTGTISWPELAEEIKTHEAILVIVNQRKHAQLLWELVGAEAHHLSTLMCPAHRLAVLERVKHDLTAGARCRVVSTQVIEAGVDIDFPVVYRAIAGADSMAQAAGRCNRNGRLPKPGIVKLFRPEDGIAVDDIRRAAGCSELMLTKGSLDLLKPETFTEFFSLFFGATDPDKERLNELRAQWDFPKVGRWRLIRDEQSRVVVPFGQGYQVLAEIEHADLITPQMYRRLQQFLVGIYDHDRNRLLDHDAITPVALEGDTDEDADSDSRLFKLRPTHRHLYSESVGLMIP